MSAVVHLTVEGNRVGTGTREECLVPKETMRTILGAALTVVPGIKAIEVSYPADADEEPDGTLRPTG